MVQKVILTLIFFFGFNTLSVGQVANVQSLIVPSWTEADRAYLLENLNRSHKEILEETNSLTKEQWNFKESPDRWSINQIVEHIALCELLLLHEISRALGRAPNPDNHNYSPDNLYLDTSPESSKKQDALDYTKPFSFAIPLGNNDGKNNVIWLTNMRNESIDYIEKAKENIRLHYDSFDNNVHQIFIMIFEHTNRHLGQLKKVKAHHSYPK